MARIAVVYWSGTGHTEAMAEAVAAGIAEGPVYLDDRDCVAKSAPPFWDHYKALGGRWDE